MQEQQSAISTLAQETFSGVRVLKVYGLEAEQTERYAASSEKSYQLNRDLYRVNALFAPLMMLLVGLSTVLTVWIGGEGVIEGRLSPGVIAEFVYYVGLLTWPIASIGWVMSLIQRAEASMERINDFLNVVPAVQQPDNAHRAAVQGAWTFDKVSYTYPDSGIQALREVSFTVQPGETIEVEDAIKALVTKSANDAAVVLAENIGELVKNERIKGISAIRDESSQRTGEPVRLVIDVKRDADPHFILNQLYQYSPLERTASTAARQ